jgi:hypothetical protein
MNTDIQCTDTFDWLIYRDATLAGLSTLIPVPYADTLVENRFRAQMPRSIADRRGLPLSDKVIERINANPTGIIGRLKHIALWPLRLPLQWLMRTWRKTVYILTVRRTVSSLAHYWRRAFLLDHMLCAGYLANGAHVDPAIATLREVLEGEQDDALTELAVAALRTVPDLPKAVWEGMEALRKRQTESLGRMVQEYMRENWQRFADYFDQLAVDYDRRLSARIEAQPAA